MCLFPFLRGEGTSKVRCAGGLQGREVKRSLSLPDTWPGKGCIPSKARAPGSQSSLGCEVG